MLKLNLNESNYNEVMREIENKQDIETAFRTNTTLDTSNKRYSVYSIYVEYRDVADFGSHNYQWVLAGYTDNGVLYLTAEEINDYNLNPYMDGEVITNLKGMIQDYPEAFYIEDVVTENLNEDTSDDAVYKEFVKNCQEAPAYKQIVRICNKYGYNRISDSIYIDKNNKIKYFNISSDERTMPELYFDEHEEIFTINTTGFRKMTNDEFKKLIKNYQNTAKMLDELSNVDLNKLYKLNK